MARISERERMLKRKEARIRAERALVDEQLKESRKLTQRVHESSNRVAEMALAIEKERSLGSPAPPSSGNLLATGGRSGALSREDLELFDARVVAVGPHAPGLIREVFKYYCNGGDGVQPRGFTQLWRDYNAMPTFFEENTVLEIIDQVSPRGGLMDYQQFREGLALASVGAFRSMVGDSLIAAQHGRFEMMDLCTTFLVYS